MPGGMDGIKNTCRSDNPILDAPNVTMTLSHRPSILSATSGSESCPFHTSGQSLCRSIWVRELDGVSRGCKAWPEQGAFRPGDPTFCHLSPEAFGWRRSCQPPSGPLRDGFIQMSPAEQAYDRPSLDGNNAVVAARVRVSATATQCSARYHVSCLLIRLNPEKCQQRWGPRVSRPRR